mmetsp:Transcript_1911/g.5064  ORF Transcript_1911/g.5064 Transcript_1911/m.5064 type:complete len:297 (+) Transcript_1911:175-1065(+)
MANTRQNLESIFHIPYLLQRVFQKGVFESEVLFDARAPTRLPVKIHVGPLLVFVRCDLGFLVPLEPGHILFVKPPGLLLKFPRRQILLVGPLFVIKNVKQGVRSQFLENGRVFKQRVRGRRVGGRCAGIGVLRGVRVGSGGRPVVFVRGWERRIGLVQDASVGGCVVPVVASREGTIGATAGSPSVRSPTGDGSGGAASPTGRHAQGHAVESRDNVEAATGTCTGTCTRGRGSPLGRVVSSGTLLLLLLRSLQLLLAQLGFLLLADLRCLGGLLLLQCLLLGGFRLLQTHLGFLLL